MGYKVPVRTREFEFKDGDLKGLVVTFRVNLTLDDFFDLADSVDALAKAKGLKAIRDALREATTGILVSWNLENGEGPIPATPENLTRHIPPLEAMNLVTRAFQEIGGLPGPLANGSGGGKPSGKRRAKSPRPN